MIVYQYETGDGDCIFRLDDLMEELRNTIEAVGLPGCPFDLHIEALEMTEAEYDALPISDEYAEDPDTIYETKEFPDSRQFIGAHRGATWTRDYVGVGGYRIELVNLAAGEIVGQRIKGTSAQMDKAEDICRFWVVQGRISASFVKARENSL
jgi:hypothetical protein